jgi:hypothetical protein
VAIPLPEVVGDGAMVAVIGVKVGVGVGGDTSGSPVTSTQ